MNKTNKLTIRTPEGITFSLFPASPVIRLLAYSIDFLIIITLNMFVSKIISILSIFSQDLAQAFSILIFFAISIAYTILIEWIWNGQTVGKKIMKIRVVDKNGLNLRFSQIVIRNLLRFIDAFPAFYLLGGISSLISSKSQRLGDIAANTVVIWNRNVKEPNFEKLFSGKYNSLREYPHLIARLRQKVSPEEADIALRAIMRRDGLNPSSRVEIFNVISQHFKKITEFDEETLEGISDEQYVRNIADVLYNT
ncbi:MAG: RDD family protein [Desulfobacterales bacterium]|nr:RDD family protein [Desulfobacterales bacterium]